VEITEVRIKLMEDAGERLHAFCSITLDDCFVIRDLKIIEGTNGPFVAMPSRKLTSHCPQCGYKNHLRALYCNQCGNRLKEDRAIKDEDGRAKLYADIAHPINSRCREVIQEKVIEQYEQELKASQLPGYVSSYDDFDEDLPRGAPRHAGQGRDNRHDGRHEPKPPRSPAREHVKAEQTKVEPATHEPRPPHKAPTQQGAGRPSNDGPNSGGFGAGIF
jgi:stage V sporulation protein G